MQPIDVLFEDNHLLVVNKPAGIATMGTTDAPSLHGWACDYLRHKYNKPGNVFVGIVSRLDTVTSGVIVMARTSKAASRLVPQFSGRDSAQATKVYCAMVDGHLHDDAGELAHWVRKDDAAHRMRVVPMRAGDPPGGDAKLATLRYVVLHRGKSTTLVAVRLMSGRKHQIRLQFAEQGYPITGDRKYGAETSFGPVSGGVPGVALHSWWLQIEHPTLRAPMSFGATVPSYWNAAASGALPKSLDDKTLLALHLPPFH